jgi:hypothetical protein
MFDLRRIPPISKERVLKSVLLPNIDCPLMDNFWPFLDLLLLLSRNSHEPVDSDRSYRTNGIQPNQDLHCSNIGIYIAIK